MITPPLIDEEIHRLAEVVAKLIGACPRQWPWDTMDVQVVVAGRKGDDLDAYIVEIVNRAPVIIAELRTLRARVAQLESALGEACDIAEVVATEFTSSERSRIDRTMVVAGSDTFARLDDLRALAARGQPPAPVGKSRPLPPTFPPPPGTCPACNWSNSNLLNYGVPGESLWLCHGCAARRIRGDGPFERPLAVLDALTLPEARDGTHCIEFTSEGVTYRIRRDADRLWVSRRGPDGSFDAWHREGTVDMRDADLPCTIVPSEVTRGG